MKLYHYSTERFLKIETRRLQGIAEQEIKSAEDKASKMGLPLPYVDHVSFFLEPIPKDTIASIFKGEHPFWKAGQTLYEHIVDTKDIDEKSFYRIVETPEIDKYTDQFDWGVKDLATRSKYFQAMNKEMLRLGWSGYGISKMVQKCSVFIGKTEGYYIQARMREDADMSRQLYAGNVPHLMIYPKGGSVEVESVKEIKLGNVKPVVTELVYHLSFRENLPTVLTPKQPDGSATTINVLTEQLPPRVSFAPTIQQCFSAIYPNVAKYFEEHNYPHMDMYVYCPLSGGKKIPKNTILERVWDSHITDEVCYVVNIKVIRVAKIRIGNPYLNKQREDIYTCPFNNPMAKRRFVSPKVDFTILNAYYPVPIL